MTDRQIQETLLNHYLFVVEMVKDAKTMRRCVEILIETFTAYSIAGTAWGVFNFNISKARWYNRLMLVSIAAQNRTMNYPILLHTKKMVISSLIARVNLLQEILNEK